MHTQDWVIGSVQQWRTYERCGCASRGDEEDVSGKQAEDQRDTARGKQAEGVRDEDESDLKSAGMILNATKPPTPTPYGVRMEGLFKEGGAASEATGCSKTNPR